jgi:hypothetical protein
LKVASVHLDEGLRMSRLVAVHPIEQAQIISVSRHVGKQL